MTPGERRPANFKSNPMAELINITKDTKSLPDEEIKHNSIRPS